MKISKFFKVCALALTLAIVAPSIAPANAVAVAQAATTIKLNKSKVSLTVGEKAKLSLTGTKSTITWKSSKKTVATVSKTGSVKAVAVGSATITATANKVKYTCKITVKAVNPNVVNAAFKAQEVTLSGFKGVIPKDWTTQVVANQASIYMAVAYPKSADITKATSR